MKRKLVSSPTALIVISCLKTAMDQFFGPFLTAYFITTSLEALPKLALHNIALYVGVALPVIILGHAMAGKNRHIVFYAGVLTELLVSAYVVVMKENLVSHVIAFGLFRGIGSQLYWYPYNHFLISEVKDEDRQRFETAKTAAGKITGILVPLAFAGIITASSYVRTSVVCLALSVISIVFALQIGEPAEKAPFHPVADLKKLRMDKPALKFAMADFTVGIYEASLSLLLPAYIVMHNSSSMNLGLLVSLASLLFVAAQLLMNRMRKQPDLAWAWIAVFVSSAVLYCVFRSFAMIVVFYISSIICGGFLSIERSVVLFTFLHNKPEAYALKEIMLNAGRITGLLMMLIVAKRNADMLPYLMVLFTLAYIPYFARLKKQWSR